MTDHPRSGASTAGTGTETSSVARVADTAGTEASRVAATATEGAKEVAGEAAAQTKAVVSEAKQQVDDFVAQTREEVRQQAEDRTARAASGLRSLSDQVAALANGRPEGAGSLPRYLEDAQEHVRRLASKLEQGGAQGVVDDLARFARRRPGLFLAGAVGAGFVAGRAVRASSGGARSHQVTSTSAVGTRQLTAQTPTAGLRSMPRGDGSPSGDPSATGTPLDWDRGTLP